MCLSVFVRAFAHSLSFIHSSFLSAALERVSAALVTEALARRSLDNVTVMCIKFRKAASTTATTTTTATATAAAPDASDSV
jgi:serine/threonine protein phosphatase PrpC